VFEEIAPAPAPQAEALCDWLDSITLAERRAADALPMSTEAGSGPWWATANPSVSSLQITAIVAARALRVAADDPAVAAHPWLERATSFCLEAIDAISELPFAYPVPTAGGDPGRFDTAGRNRARRSHPPRCGSVRSRPASAE
jgi:hypothetical protein